MNMNVACDYGVVPIVSSTTEAPQAEVERLGRLLHGKVAAENMLVRIRCLGNANANPSLGSVFASTTSSAVLSQHLLAHDKIDPQSLLPSLLGFVVTPTVGVSPSVAPIAQSLKTLHDYYWGGRLISAQRICSQGQSCDGSSDSKKKPGNADVPTAGASLPTIMFSNCDKSVLSEYQCLVRQQLEFFESSKEDIRWSKQGRNKNLVPGQVGIRCKWCSHLPTQCLSPGAVYYSATLDGLYQAAQNMVKNHLHKEECRHIPPDIESRLNRLRNVRRRGPGGKKYWAEGARVIGIYEYGGRLKLKQSKV